MVRNGTEVGRVTALFKDEAGGLSKLEDVKQVSVETMDESNSCF